MPSAEFVSHDKIGRAVPFFALLTSFVSVTFRLGRSFQDLDYLQGSHDGFVVLVT